MQGTLTFTGGNVDPNASYSLTLQKEKKVASTLSYTSTDYEGGNILIGDPDDILNAYKPGGSVVVNETRDDYYLRYNISSELTFVATQQQTLENLNVENVKTDYAPGEAPRATATLTSTRLPTSAGRKWNPMGNPGSRYPLPSGIPTPQSTRRA